MTADDTNALERFAAVFDYYAGEMPLSKAAACKGVARAFAELDEDLIPAADLYIECRMAGSSPRLSLMLASKRTPHLNTDTSFMAGKHNLKTFDEGKVSEEQGKYRVAVAKSLGRKDVDSCAYSGQLAQFPGDPEGFYASKSEFEGRIRARGWTAEGAVNVSQPELPAEVKKKMPKPSDYLTAEDLK